MAQNSKIEWCDHTFNPWMGCTRVSPGCQHCYAETLMDHRYKKVKWGPQGQRVLTAKAYWKQPLKWNMTWFVECEVCDLRQVFNQFGRCPGCEHPMEATMKPVRQRVFCGSLCDVFEERAEIRDWRSDLFELIEQTPNLDWLLLTKRPENVKRSLPDNVWIGTSVENQAMADKRIPVLVQIPAKVHFLSVEPMLEKIDLDLRGTNYGRDHATWSEDVSWVICGGESGPDARPMNPEWVQSLRDQCKEADVPFFFKQWGEYLPVGGPEHYAFEKMGKHRSGRVVDGQEWNEFPK